MKYLDRYLIRAVLDPAILAFAITSTLIVSRELSRRSDSALAQVLTLTDVARMAVYVFPSVLPYVLPLSIFFGALAGYGKLTERGELTAMFAGGMSIARLIVPSIALGIAAVAASVSIQNYLQPWGMSRAFELLSAEIPARATIDKLGPGVVHKIDNWRVYFQSGDIALHEIYGVDVVRFEPGQGATVFHADSARVEPDAFGQSLILGKGFTVSSDRIRTSMARAVLPVPSGDRSPPRTKAHLQMNLNELLAEERSLSAPTAEPSPKNRLYLRKMRREIADRLSLPFVAIGLAAIAPLLVIHANRGRRSSRVRAFVIGLFIVIAYYVGRVMTQPENPLSIELALTMAWLPNFALLIAAAFMYWRLIRAAG